MPFLKLVANAADAKAQRASVGQVRRHAPPCRLDARTAAAGIECEVEGSGDVLVELLGLIEFGHDQDQSIEQIIADIRRSLDKGALS